MRTITINKDSWHYRLLRFYDFSARQSDNFCAYTRGVLWAMFLSLVLSTLVVLATISAAHFIAWIAAMLIYWQGIEPEVWIIIAAAAVGLSALFGFAFIAVHTVLAANTATRKAYAALPDEQKVKLSDWLAAFREKVCFRVNYL